MKRILVLCCTGLIVLLGISAVTFVSTACHVQGQQNTSLPKASGKRVGTGQGSDPAGAAKHSESSAIESAFSYLPVVYTGPEFVSSDSTLAFIVSGDGGWAKFAKKLSSELAGRGIPSIGLNAFKYFWRQKTPDQTARDMNAILSFYVQKLHVHKIMLLGYSFGADIVPFIATRLTPSLKKELTVVAMYSPSAKTNFEVTIGSMLEFGTEDRYDVLKEVTQLPEVGKICIYGDDEHEDEMIKQMKAVSAPVVVLSGRHHYHYNLKSVVDSTLHYCR